MIFVEQCANWHEMDTGRGKHCFNCVHRNGYPQRAQPSKSCENFIRLPMRRALGAAHGCCEACHKTSDDKKCFWCRNFPITPVTQTT
jgi:hypothetical protein